MRAFEILFPEEPGTEERTETAEREPQPKSSP
jgi:hypothetical protein